MKFSIITPVYNREDCIARCIESTISQGYDSWEHIIVDDGSSDKTAEIVQKYLNLDSRILLYKMPQNRGTNAARNQAIKHVKGEFVLFLDSDDFLSESALLTIDNAIKLHSNYLHYLFVQDDMIDKMNASSLLTQESKEVLYENWVRKELYGDFVHVMNKEMVQRFLFDEDLRIYEELNFMVLYRFSKKQMFINSVVVHRDRKRKDSVTTESMLFKPNALKFQYNYLQKMISNFNEDYKKYCPDIFSVMVKRCLLFSLALSDYDYYKKMSNETGIYICGGSIICALNLGNMLKGSIQIYSKIKHIC